MRNDKPGDVKEFWGDRAKDDSVSDSAVTHHDIWQRWLEIELIRKNLDEPIGRLLDIGCGTGYTTKKLVDQIDDEIVGMDYSEEMIERARSSVTDQAAIRFEVGDVLELGPDRFGHFDAAVTERCLINLQNWEEQQTALTNIASVLKPGGKFIFVEGSQNGRAALDELRTSHGLDPMPRVWHNIDFEENATLEFLERSFALEQRLHFGTYDFISRVVHPLVVAPDAPQYDSKFNEIAARLAVDSQVFGDMSRVLFLVLRKR